MFLRRLFGNNRENQETEEEQNNLDESPISLAEDLFKGKDIKQVIEEILSMQDWKLPLTNRHSFINEYGYIQEEFVIKDCNLIISGGKISDIIEMGVPSTLQAERALKQDLDGLNENEGNKQATTNSYTIDVSKIPIYLFETEDKDIEYGNIQTDIAHITLVDGEIDDIILYGKFFDNDGNDSIGNNTAGGSRRNGKFGGNLMCRIVKTERGFEGKIEMRELDDPIFLKAARESGFNEEEIKKASCAKIILDNIRIFLGDKKYSNDTVVKFLDPKMSNYEDDDEENKIILHEIGGLSKDGSLTTNKNEGKEKNKGILYKISLVGLGIFMAGTANLVKDIVYKNKTTSHPNIPKLVNKVTAQDLENDKGNIPSLLESITTQHTITIKKGDWFGRAVENYVRDNGLKQIPNLKTFINENKQTGNIDLENVNPGDSFTIDLEKTDQGTWNIIWAEKVK